MGDFMKYIDNVRYMEGIIIEADDCSVSIDFKGRMGFMKVPRRLLITDYEVEVGQEVALNMSYVEVIDGTINEKYISNIDERRSRKNEKETKEVII